MDQRPLYKYTNSTLFCDDYYEAQFGNEYGTPLLPHNYDRKWF